MRESPEATLIRLAIERGGKVLGMDAGEKPRRPSKYKNKPTTYNGIRYDSQSEAAYAQLLDLRYQANDIAGWTRQVTFYLGVTENRIKVDFVVWELDGTAHADEVKGVRTAKCMRDFRLWARYGPCELRVITDGRVVEVIRPRA